MKPDPEHVNCCVAVAPQNVANAAVAKRILETCYLFKIEAETDPGIMTHRLLAASEEKMTPTAHSALNTEAFQNGLDVERL